MTTPSPEAERWRTQRAELLQMLADALRPIWSIPDDPALPDLFGFMAEPLPELDVEIPEPNPVRWSHLPQLPRPAKRPPMWAARADGRRR